MSGVWGQGWESDFGGQLPAGQEIPGSDRIGKAIRDVIEAAMGMPAGSVRPADQAAPAGRTGTEFATYKIIGVRDAATAEHHIVTDSNGADVEGITVPQYLTVSVNFFRGRDPKTDDAGLPRFTTAAYDRAMRLPRRLQLSAFSQMLKDAGLGFCGASSPRNLSGLADGHWESRGQIDITISAVASETAPVTTFSGIGSIGITVENPADLQSTKTIT